MNKRYLVEVMKNSKNENKHNYNKIDEMKKLKRRFKILEDKTHKLEKNDPRKFLIKSEILNIVIEMNNYLINKKCE